VSPRRSLAWYGAIAVAESVLLEVVPAPRGHCLAQPVTCERDALFFTAVAGVACDDGSFRAARIGAR
jgi:hypothetical protein